MIEDSKKRLEFMESIQKIKEDKIQRAYSDHSKVYNFINQTFEERREKVLNNKEKECKLKIFNIYKRQIRTELKHKLNDIKKNIKRMNTKTWFWIKLLYATKYISLCKDKYEITRHKWLTGIKQHIATKRIDTHWK